MSNTVISVEHLSKQYDLGVIGTGTLTRDLERWWARTRHKPDPYSLVGTDPEKSWLQGSILALDDVSFTVQQGEALGIIGKNGAGKSTLLKILSRVTAPTSGVVKVKGRIGSLLEVGTGFHPELTGRENVYLNGAILGMKRAEVDRKFDEIVAFSGVEKFIDTPVKRYSSGMYVRLAFAVAAHLDPEILVVDEVLAVGDAEFQKKCLGKMSDVAGEGRTVLFVSHNMGTLMRLCPIALWLKDGHIESVGKSDEVVEAYLNSGLAIGSGRVVYPLDGTDGEVRFISLEIVNEQGELATSFHADEPITFRVRYQVKQDISGVNLAVMIMTAAGDHLWEISDVDYLPELFEKRQKGQYLFTCTAPANVLKPGTYRIQLGAGDARRKLHRPDLQALIEITPKGYWKQSYQYFGLSRAPIVVPWAVERPVIENPFPDDETDEEEE